MTDALTFAAWNGVLNVAGFNNGSPLAAPLTLPTSGVSSDTGGTSLHDYVRFTLFNNTTVTVDGNQLFALDGFSFSDDQTLDIGSASSGAGAGKVTFNPLHLSFTQPGLDPQLFQMLAAGTLFKEVDVLGYNVSGDGSHLVVDYSFGLVAGKTMSIDQSGITQLDLEFGQQEIQHFTQNPDGSFPSTPDTSGGWDRVRNIQVGPDQFADPPLTLPTSGVSSDTGGISLHDYVRFTLFNNTTVTVDGNQLFALDGFSFSDDQTLDIGSASSGAGAGKVTFNPLHLSFTQPGLDPQLFQMLAAGTLFKEVDVLGYNVSGDGSHLVVDYSFGLVAGKTMSIDQSGITQLDLEFGQQEIQHFTQNPDGSFPSTPDTSGGWDRVRNIQVGPDQFADPPLTLPTSGVSSDTGGISLHDYVRFTLFNNTTVTVDGNQLFALDGFSFSDDQTLDIGSASSGAGAGKVTFNPLHLSFTQPGLDPQLFQMLAAGTLFKEVDVLGYNVSGDGSHLVVDYSFGLVAGKTMSIDQSGITQLDLEFGQQEIQHFTQNPDGSFPSTPDTSGGWDRVRNIQVGPDQFADPPLTLPTSGVSSDTGGISLHDYVRFTLFNNTTVTVDGNQLFALDGFSFSDDQTLDIGSASSGAGAGKVTFNPLHLSFTQPGLDPQLFQMLAAGTLFKEVDVLGYNVSGDGSHLVVDYSFGLVAGKTMSIDQSGITQLDLEYGSQAIQFGNQAPVAADDPSIVLVGGTAAGNVLTNDSDPDGDSLTVSAVAGLSGNVGAPLAGTYGHLTLDADGSFSYAADKAAAIAAGATGSHLHDIFSYTASDGLGGTDNASLDITLDRLPVAADDTSGALAGGTAAGNVLVNDSDPDGDSLTVSAVFAAGLPGNVATPLAGKFGDLTLNADGSFNYAADKAAAIAAGATGNHLHDIFSYTASDGLGGTDNAILDITLDRLPVTADDTSGALAGGTAAGNVLANDNDPDGDSLTVSAVFAAGLPGNVATPLAGKFGDLTLNADGSFTYAADNAAAIAAGPTGSHCMTSSATRPATGWVAPPMPALISRSIAFRSQSMISPASRPARPFWQRAC